MQHPGAEHLSASGEFCGCEGKRRSPATFRITAMDVEEGPAAGATLAPPVMVCGQNNGG